MKPQNSLILVKFKEETEKKTESGVILPASTGNKAIGFLRKGEVVAVNKKEEEEKDIKVGDSIYFNINAITLIPNEDELILVRKEDIYLVI